MLKEFKAFILRGNVVDLAVGIVIGAAFTAVVSTFVANILTPFIAAMVGKQDFSELSFSINGSQFKYGLFVNAVVFFLIVALAIFLVIRQLNRLSRKPAPSMRDCPQCLSPIPLKAVRCKFCTQPV